MTPMTPTAADRIELAAKAAFEAGVAHEAEKGIAVIAVWEGMTDKAKALWRKIGLAHAAELLDAERAATERAANRVRNVEVGLSHYDLENRTQFAVENMKDLRERIESAIRADPTAPA